MRAARTVRSLLAAALLVPGAVAATAPSAHGAPCPPWDAGAGRRTWSAAVPPPKGCSVQGRHPTRLTAGTAVIRLSPPRWAHPPVATLTDAATGLPVPGQAVAFTTGSTPLCAAVPPPKGCSVQGRHPTRLTAGTAVIRLSPPRWAHPPVATLTDAATGLPVPGQAVAFTTGSTPLCAAVTDLAGQAACGWLRGLPSGPRQGWYAAWYAGDAVREPAGALGRLVTVGDQPPG